MKRLPLIVSFLLFIVLCASLAYWALQVFKPPLRAVAAPPRAAKTDIAPEAAAGLFGGRPGKLAVASNYQLKGVIMSGTAGDSVAILSADGKSAQAFAMNKEVMPGTTVKEVHRTYVLLSENGVTKRVELPESAKAQLNIAAAAPVGSQGAAAPVRSQPPSTSPAAPQSKQTPNNTAATAPAQPTPRSAVMPPATQTQTQPPAQATQQAQTPAASAAPPNMVVSPPAATTAQPAPSAAPAAASNMTGAPASTPFAAATQAPATAAAPSAPAQSSGSSAGSEMLPPSTLQSR